MKKTTTGSKKHWALGMGLALALAAGPALALPAPSAIASETVALTSGVPTTHTTQAGEEDVFTIPAPNSGYVYFTAKHLRGDGSIDLSIWSNGTKYYDGDTLDYGEGEIKTSAVALPAGQSVELHVASDSGNTNSYSVRAITVSPQDFETEPNDEMTPGSANRLQADGIVSGIANDPDIDTDCYFYEAGRSGDYTVSAKVTEGVATSSSDYDGSIEASLYDGDGKCIAGSETFTRGDAWKDLGRISLERGERLFVKVQKERYGYADVFYQLKLSYVPAQQGKTDEKANADGSLPLTNGVPRTRTTQADTTDRFSIAAPEKGYVYFTIKVTKEDGDITPAIEADNKRYWEGSSISYGDGSQNTAALSLQKGSLIELSIAADHGAPTTYTITPHVITQGNFETESNNAFSSATNLPADKVLAGLANQEDTDYFVCPAPAKGQYKVSLRVISGPTTGNLSNCSLSATTYKGQDSLIGEYSVSGGDGWTDLEDEVSLSPGEKLYVKVDNGSSSDESDIFYEIKVSYTPVEDASANKGADTKASTGKEVSKSNASRGASAPKGVALKSVKGKKKSLLVKWAKGKDIDGYRIRYSTSRGFSKKTTKVKSASAAKTKLTIKKLKSKKRYYVQIQTYKKQAKSPYSSWSRVLSAGAK